MKPAPESRTSVSASSTTMRTPVQRRARRPRSRAPAFLEDFVDVGLRHVQRRREAEDDAGAEADRREESKHPRVEGELDPIRLADVRDRRVEQADADDRQPEAEHAADDRQQQAFDQQLPHDAPTGRSQRDADRDFARAVGRSREEQVGDVCARDQQHEADRAHQRQEDQLDLAAVVALVERHHRRGDVFVGRREIVREPRGDGAAAPPAPVRPSRRAQAGRRPRSCARRASVPRGRPAAPPGSTSRH